MSCGGWSGSYAVTRKHDLLPALLEKLSSDPESSLLEGSEREVDAHVLLVLQLFQLAELLLVRSQTLALLLEVALCKALAPMLASRQALRVVTLGRVAAAFEFAVTVSATAACALALPRVAI
eukprot:257808-Rhodomonas_salina.1